MSEGVCGMRPPNTAPRLESRRAELVGEWEAWHTIVKEWRKVAGEINEAKYNLLVKAIREWGEALAALRYAEQSAMEETPADSPCLECPDASSWPGQPCPTCPTYIAGATGKR